MPCIPKSKEEVGGREFLGPFHHCQRWINKKKRFLSGEGHFPGRRGAEGDMGTIILSAVPHAVGVM